jgi:uncharacterized protein (DUF433 family)
MAASGDFHVFLLCDVERAGPKIPPTGSTVRAPIVRPAQPTGMCYKTRRIWEELYVGPMNLPRITIDPAVCTGKPCIRGLRFPVARLLGLLAAGETREEILASYPYLEPEDIGEALRYAALLAEDETIEMAR